VVGLVVDAAGSPRVTLDPRHHRRAGQPEEHCDEPADETAGEAHGPKRDCTLSADDHVTELARVQSVQVRYDHRLR
jgi:hypothetical protein